MPVFESEPKVNIFKKLIGPYLETSNNQETCHLNPGEKMSNNRDSSDLFHDYPNETPSADFWRRIKLKWNGGHHLLPTTDSPTLSACTTSTNLSNLEFQSSSTINKFLTGGREGQKIKEENLKITITETQYSKSSKSSKIDMTINSTKQDIETSAEQYCEKRSVGWSSLSGQVIAAIFVSWVSMVIGYVSGYTSPAEIPMKKELQITDFQFSLISGAMPLAAMFGGLAGGPSIEKLGRKKTILITDVLFLVGWLVNYFAQNVWYLSFSRSISGFAVGIASLTLPVYLGETIQPEVRGTLGLLPTAFGNIGILLAYSMGFFLQWKNIAGVGALLTVPFLLLFWIIPETPRWYVSKGRVVEAEKALGWLRGKNNSDATTKEFEELKKTHKMSDEKTYLRDLFVKPNLKSFLIVIGLMFFQQMSGINAVIFYTTQIFEDTGSSIPPAIQTIIVGAVNFISTFIATILIDRLGRKVLLYISSVTMVITLGVLGVFFYLKNVVEMDLTEYGLIPLISAVVYVLGFSFGFGPIPWLMMGEILPSKVRGLAASVSTGFNWTCTFIVTTTFPLFKDVMGEHGAFWLFCGITIIGLVFTILAVPETKGQSLEDIERKLAGVKVRRMSSVANMKPLQSTF